MGANEIMMAFSNATEGRDEEFNSWYSEEHIPDILRVSGIVSARRYRLADIGVTQQSDYEYLVIYEIEPGRTPEARAGLSKAKNAGEVRGSEALGSFTTLFFVPIADV